MQKNNNTPYYIAALGLGILLKLYYKILDVSDLTFILKPTNYLIGHLTGSTSVFIEDNGYFHEQLNIVIDKSCSGFNFWVLCFLLFAFLIVKHIHQRTVKILAIPLALICGYVTTLVVTTSRIFVSIVIQQHTENIIQSKHYLIHEAIGIITNLTFLILAYLLAEKLLKNKRLNEKLA